MADSDHPPRILRPMPQRTYKTTLPSPTSTPLGDAEDTSSPTGSRSNGIIPSSRTRSILNLTSSTLFGIYQPSDIDSMRDDVNTPFGSGSITPQGSRTPIQQTSSEDKQPPNIGAFGQPKPYKTRPERHPTATDLLVPVMLRSMLLFVIGMAYATMITVLHDNEQLPSVNVHVDRYSWPYYLYWGTASVAWGNLLPWIDSLWEDFLGNYPEYPPISDDSTAITKKKGIEDKQRPSSSRTGLGADWNPIVRGIGVFFGIAFAIRRLPWESTLQVSLTLALVNPVLWYLFDRSRPGFLLSSVVSILGTIVLLGINPDMVPPPATPSPPFNGSHHGLSSEQLISPESIGGWTWVASVLFCSCICSGNIGRKLALGRLESKKRASE